MSMSVVVAGGGTAGHIEPAMNLADHLRDSGDPDVGITALGTQKGLETRLVPARGYPLRADPAGAAAAQAQQGAAHPAGPGAGGRGRREGGDGATSRPMSSSASAATCPCRPTWPPGP